MAIMGVLNVLGQADTSNYDRGMEKMGRQSGMLRAKVQADSQAMTAAMNGMGRGVGSLSGLGDMASSVAGRVMGPLSAAFDVARGSATMLGNTGSSAMSMLSVGVAGVAGATVAAAAAIVGFGVGLHAWASSGAADIKHVYDMANNLEISIGALTAYSLAPGIDGIEQVGNLIYRLQGQMENLSPRAEQAFAAMRINPEQLRGANAEQQIRMLAAGYGNLAGQVERAGAMRALFGRGSMPMMDLLEGGTVGIDRLQDRVQRFGLDVSESQALALRRSNSEWRGFGLAIQGVGRQAAIMFTPAWEAIGKVGSKIGEWMVTAFRTAQPYIEQFTAASARLFGPLWEAIQNIGGALGEIFIASMPLIEQFAELFMVTIRTIFSVLPVNGIMESVFGDIGFIRGIVEAVKAIIPWVKITLEIFAAVIGAIGEIGLGLWSVVWSAVRAIGTAIAWAFNATGIVDWFNTAFGGATTLKDMLLGGMATFVVAIRNLGRTWEIIMDTIKLKWLEFVRMMVGNLPAALQNQLRDILPSLNANQLDGQIRDLRNNVVRGMDNFRADVNAQIGRWNFELGGGLLRAARQAVREMEQAAQVTELGQLRARTGHEAVTAQSEAAFSMLYGTRGNQDYYQRQAAEALAGRGGVRDLMRDFLGEMRGAPAIRRARL